MIQQKRLYPFFISLPQDVPVDWMIPLLFFIEGIKIYLIKILFY